MPAPMAWAVLIWCVGFGRTSKDYIRKKMMLNIPKNQRIVIQKNDKIILLEETTQKNGETRLI